MARENQGPAGEDGPTDVLSPFLALQPAAPEEVGGVFASYSGLPFV